MNGTVDGYLGTLYDRVPGWPIGFGDQKKAELYFQQALAENPSGIDLHFMYGKYLFHRGKTADARLYLTKGLDLPVRQEHADYDEGRRQDIETTLAEGK
jgi:hypothetical protein